MICRSTWTTSCCRRRRGETEGQWCLCFIVLFLLLLLLCRDSAEFCHWIHCRTRRAPAPSSMEREEERGSQEPPEGRVERTARGRGRGYDWSIFSSSWMLKKCDFSLHDAFLPVVAIIVASSWLEVTVFRCVRNKKKNLRLQSESHAIARGHGSQRGESASQKATQWEWYGRSIDLTYSLNYVYTKWRDCRSWYV